MRHMYSTVQYSIGKGRGEGKAKSGVERGGEEKSATYKKPLDEPRLDELEESGRVGGLEEHHEESGEL